MRHRRARAPVICLAWLVAFSTTATPAADANRSALPGGWHLIRTKNPNGGPDAVSVSHTADVIRSDLDFAGVMLRCGQKDIEVIVVAVTPFSPRAKTEVTVRVDAQEWRFVPKSYPRVPSCNCPSRRCDWRLAPGDQRANSRSKLFPGAVLRWRGWDRGNRRGARRAKGLLHARLSPPLSSAAGRLEPSGLLPRGPDARIVSRNRLVYVVLMRPIAASQSRSGQDAWAIVQVFHRCGARNEMQRAHSYPRPRTVGCCYIGCRQRRRCINMFHYCSAGLCRPADRLSGRRCDAILCRVGSTCQSRGAEVTLSPADP